MVELEDVVDDADVLELKTLLENHVKYTDSDIAKSVLADWDASLKNFTKVMPVDYKRALKELAEEAAAATA